MIISLQFGLNRLDMFSLNINWCNKIICSQKPELCYSLQVTTYKENKGTNRFWSNEIIFVVTNLLKTNLFYYSEFYLFIVDAQCFLQFAKDHLVSYRGEWNGHQKKRRNLVCSLNNEQRNYDYSRENDIIFLKRNEKYVKIKSG